MAFSFNSDILTPLVNLTSNLQAVDSNIQTNVQAALNTRVANAQQSLLNATAPSNFVGGALGSAGQNIFTPSSIANITNLINQFKVSTDPRQAPNSPTVSGQLTNFSNFFSNLEAGSAYQVMVQGDTLNGLVATTQPIIPMIFNIVAPPTSAGSTTPPIMLLVTPKSWSRANNKVQNNTYVRGGIKTERWGEEFDQITAEGDISGFYTMETGLTRFYRRLTPSYRTFLELVQIYRNNGCSFGKTYPGSEVAPLTNTRIVDVGHVEILYGFELFRGTFETFTIKEEANRPFTVGYTFVFNVSESISIHDILSQSTELAATQGTSASTSSNLMLTPGQQLLAPVALSDQNQNQALTVINATTQKLPPLPPPDAYGVLSLPPNLTSQLNLADVVTGLTYRFQSKQQITTYQSLISQLNSQIQSAHSLPPAQATAAISALQIQLNQVRSQYLTIIATK